MAILKHRQKGHSSGDLEKGDPDLDEQRPSMDQSRMASPQLCVTKQRALLIRCCASVVGYEKGDEYEILLRYVQDQAELARHKRDEAAAADEGETMRLWYAPWKKVKVQSVKEKTVSPCMKGLCLNILTSCQFMNMTGPA